MVRNRFICRFSCKNTKTFKNLQVSGGNTTKICKCEIFFVTLHRNFDMSKRIEYIMPVNWICGSISGRQNLEYNGVHAYELQSDALTPADYYRPTLVARYTRTRDLRYYQVRTRTSVRLSAPARLNLAVLGGAGAIFAALVNRGEDVHRSISFPVLMDMLRTKASSAQCEGVAVDNPWRVQNPNVSIAPAIINKFQSVLS